MIEAEIEPDDLRSLNIAFKGLIPAEILKGELAPFAKQVGIVAGKYPPPVPSSRYVRTHHLDRSWYFRLLSPESVEVGNLATYAGWVHGPQQVDYHGAHGWRRLFEIADSMIIAFVRKIEAKVDRIWR